MGIQNTKIPYVVLWHVVRIRLCCGIETVLKRAQLFTGLADTIRELPTAGS